MNDWRKNSPNLLRIGPRLVLDRERDYLLTLLDEARVEVEELESLVGNLLARIFRDGGQRAGMFSSLTEAAGAADAEVASLFGQIEELKTQAYDLRIEAVIREGLQWSDDAEVQS